MSEMKSDKLFDDFLTSLSAKNTKKLYRKGLELFAQFCGKSISEMLEMRKQDLEVKPNQSIVEQKQLSTRFEREFLEPFYLHLTKDVPEREPRKYSPISASSYAKAVMAILRFYSMSFGLRKGSPISEGANYEGEGRFDLSIEDVRKMFFARSCDLEFKTYLSLSVDCGFRISEILGLKVKDLPNLDESCPIEFTVRNKKERIIAHTCLSKLTVDLCKELINVYERKPEDKLINLAESTCERRLKELASEVGINYKGKGEFTAHMFRDLRIKTAQNMQISEYIYKRMVGKSIEKSMRGYSSRDVKTAFEKMSTVLSINGSVLAKENNDMLSEMAKTMASMKTMLEEDRGKIDELKKALDKLGKLKGSKYESYEHV